MTRRRLLVTLAALALAATASAQCARGPETSEVTLPDFLAVYFTHFRSFAAQDAAEFYGGVCVTDVGGEWTVIAAEVRLEGLSGDLELEAPEPTLYLGEWRITADLLVADATGLTLVNAVLDGPDASGSASGLDVDLLSGQMTLVGLSLAGSAFAVRGDLAVLKGTALRVEGVGLTTCIGLEEAPYEVEGEVAHVDLSTREVRIRSGLLRVGQLRLPLRDEVVVSEATFADFELPVKVTFVAGGTERLGAGLSVRIVGIPAGEGVDLVLGATGLDAEHVTQAVALLELQAEVPEQEGTSEVRAVVGVEASAPYLDFGVTREVGPGLRFEFGVVSGAQPARPARHEGRLGLSAAADLPLAGVPGLSAKVGAEAFAAVTAVTAAALAPAPEVVGPRLGVSGSASATWRAGPATTFGLVLGAEATYYPRTMFPGAEFPGAEGAAGPAAASALQWGARVAPSWRYASGPLSLALSYDARFTNAASPFGTRIDRLVPLQRAQGNVTLSGELARAGAGVVTGSFGVSAVYDPLITSTPAGLKQLTLAGAVNYAAEPWNLRLGGRSELSGLLAATGRDPFVELDLTATLAGWPVLNPGATHPWVPHGTLELGLLANYSLLPGEEELAALELSAAVPLAFETFELRPYLAFDFAPTVTAGRSPRWSGYGLDATFITCCGSLTIGLLNDRGAWSAGIGVDLERRPRREPDGGGTDPGTGPDGGPGTSPQ